MPPPQNCRPGEFTGKAVFDTVSDSPQGVLVHYQIVHLDAPANSRDNDLGAAFINNSGVPAVAVTSDRESDTARQAVWMFASNRFDAFSDGRILGGFASNGGAMVVDRSTFVAYFSAPRAGGQIGDYDIYTGHLNRDAGGWKISGISPLSDSVNKQYSWEGQPALAPDGNTLYFASDRQGGEGGTDIWCTRKGADGKWGRAFNVGPAVNTACDELTPFVTLDGAMLYFASSGHETVGGYDLFRSPIVRGIPGPAENLAPPVNTPFDEIFPTTYGPADSVLYYSSTQLGGLGGFDLYVMRRIVGRQPKLAQPVERPIVAAPQAEYREKIVAKTMIMDTVPKIDTVPLSGKVMYSRTKIPIPEARVTWKQLPARDSTGSVKTDDRGTYTLTLRAGKSYEVSAQSSKSFYDVVQIATPPPAEHVTPMVHNFELPETLALRVNFPFNMADRPYEYALNDSGQPSTLTCMVAMDLLADNIKLFRAKLKELKLIGHTDSSGSDQYNERLGMRRAQWVKNQLVMRGVPAELITVESRGRTEPVLRRPAEADDAFAARCRRTELAKVFDD